MLHIKTPSNDLNDYLEIEKKFNIFLHYLASIVCPQQCQIQFHGDHCRYRTKWGNHNKGAFVRILADGPPVSRELIKKWTKDTEHGLLHGIITAFFSTINRHQEIPKELFLEQKSDKINTPITFEERLVISCLMHDFVKSCFEEEPHDTLLKNWFSSLVDEAYDHANPSKISDLVIADRWELMRYKDHSLWLKSDLLEFKSAIQKRQITCFQKHLRPALEKLFLGVDDVWLRHTPERMWINDQFQNLKNDSIYPPTGFWPARQDAKEFYAIEIGTMPPRGCLLHGYTRNNSLTDDDPASYSPYGMVSLTDAKKHFIENDFPMISPCVRVDKDTGTLGRQIWPVKKHLSDDWQEIIKKDGYANSTFISRDHLAMQSKIPLKDWLFLYDDNRDIPSLAERGRRKIERDWPSLFKHSAGLVNLHIAANLLELAKQIETVLVCVRT